MEIVWKLPFDSSYLSNYNSTSQHSVGPGDYEAINMTLTFDSNTQRHDISITLVDDTIDELDETLTSLLVLDSPDSSVTLSPSETMVMIVDNDGKLNK